MSAQQFSKYTGGLREPGTPVLERMASAGLDVTWYLTGKAPAADTNDPNALLDLEVIPLGELVTAAMRMNERQGELLERIRQATA